jgi:predicted glycosyltransferase
MNIFVYLGHPAHFHLFKIIIKNLINHHHKVIILIKKKDVLEQLLKESGLTYCNILTEGRKDSKIGMLWGIIKRAWRLWHLCNISKPNILTGTSVENSFIGKIKRIPVINVGEDDADVVPLYAKLSYPWASAIVTPTVCDCGKWNEKSTKYDSYHELAYLHPNHFIPDRTIVEKYFSPDDPYFIMRFVKLNAHHDNGIRGINCDIADKIIQLIEPYGNIYITSERELEPQFEKYRIAISPIDIHHVMAFAQMYIGDSQTMAAESGVLGVPFIRFNDFVGRIGYLRELETVYNLGYGIYPHEEDKLYSTIINLLNMPDRSSVFQKRRENMLSEKIDYAQFLTWFIENYPQSQEIMKQNPEYQYRFK